MKYFVPTLIIALMATSYSHAQSLDTKTRADAIKWLNEYKAKIAASKNKRISAAQLALSSAAGSESNALTLYKNSKKETDFKKRAKNETEVNTMFLAWDRSQRDTFSRPGYKKALQLQCKWILLGMKVAIAEKSNARIDPTSEMLDIINSIASAKEVIDCGDAFNNAASSIKQALLINDLKPKLWVETPLNVSGVFDQIILPAIKETKNIQNFRNTWLRRIDLERRIIIDPRNEKELANEIQSSTRNGRNNRGGRNDNKDPKKPVGIAGQRAGTALKDLGKELHNDTRRFREEKMNDEITRLQWAMEVACFQIGDEITATNNLRTILSNTKDPALVERRVSELSDLLEGKTKEAVFGPSEGDADMSKSENPSNPIDDALFGDGGDIPDNTFDNTPPPFDTSGDSAPPETGVNDAGEWEL